MVFNPLYKKAYEYSWEGTRKPYTMKSSKEKFQRFDELTRNPQAHQGYNTSTSWNRNQSNSNSPVRAAHPAGINMASTFSGFSTNTFS